MYALQIFCGCKTNCASSRCSCKKNGLKCNNFCKSCRGQRCDNKLKGRVPIEDDDCEDVGEEMEVDETTEEMELEEDETPSEEEHEESLAVRDSSSPDEIDINFEKF